MPRTSSPAKRFTGSPCRTCGGTERYRNGGGCCACYYANATAWRLANPERMRAFVRKSHAKHPETSRAWVEANRDKCRAKGRRWAERYPDKQRARHALWSAKNPGKASALTRAWQKAHPDEAKALVAKRIARQKGAVVGCRKEYSAFLKWVRTEPVIPCTYCKRDTAPKERHRDHYIPLARGGADTAENLRVACASCNHRKHALMPEEFLRRIA